MAKTKVYIVFGGKSGEHEVSIRSARSVMEAIDREKYEPELLAIAKNGTWLRGPQARRALMERTSIDRGSSMTLLPPLPKATGLISSSAEPMPSVVFPVLHGPYGEDGTVQGMLEMMNVPYVGSGVLGSALGMDKVIQKQVFAQYGLPVVRFSWFLMGEWLSDRQFILRKISRECGKYPLFVKPANLGSSVGISKAHNEKELVSAIRLAGQYDRKIIVEQGKEGIREIEVSVLGNDKPEASVCGEIIPDHEFYDYDAKYFDEKTRLMIPADIPKKIQDTIRNMATTAFRALDCWGFSRVDFFLEKQSGNIWLNEINTIPGFTSVSMYPKLWEASGVSYPTLIDKLIQLGVSRWKEKQRLATSR